MANLYDYLEEYGDVSFKRKKFNVIDNFIFCELSYLNYTDTKINNGIHTIEQIGKEYLKKNKLKDIRKLGIPQKEAYEVLEVVVNKKRYKNLKFCNYDYIVNKNIQFSAMTFKIAKDLNYICFEGTNEHISGWKEDGELACFFPIPSHIEAIKYVNKHVKLFGPKVIIGGHSKGGNIALVAGMCMKSYKKHKVINIYSNDGPGLRKKEFESKKYQKIKNKLIHIVPHYSLIGILLRNDVYHVVKSSKKTVLGHAMSTWQIKDDKLVEEELSEKSKRLEKSFIKWLDNHDDEERLKLINNMFKVFEDADITRVIDIPKIKNLIKVIRNIHNVDKETKNLFADFVIFNIKNTEGWNKKDIELLKDS